MPSRSNPLQCIRKVQFFADDSILPRYISQSTAGLEKFKFYVTVSFAAANHSGAVWELDLFGVDLVTVHVVHGNCAGMMLCRGALATTRTRTTS